MKKVFYFGVLAIGLVMGCDKDEATPSCKKCSAEVTQSVDGQLFGTTTISEVEYCDSDLATIEANPSTTITQTVSGITQEVTTTYTCK